MITLASFQRWSTLLRPRSLTFFLQPVTIRGPRTFSGRSQVGAPDAGYWTAKMGFQIETRAELLEWRGTIADMEGGLVPYLIGPFDERQASVIPGQPLWLRTTHSDGTSFSDDSNYVQSTIQVQLRNDLDIGDTQATFDVVSAGPLCRGMYFSFDGRLYTITRPPEALQNGAVRVRFLPEARAAVPAGTEANFADPLALMQIADPKSGAANIVAWSAIEPTIELEESFEGLD